MIDRLVLGQGVPAERWTLTFDGEKVNVRLVGESVILCYGPRDVAEIRVFHDQRFLCRAICPELAGETVSLRDIVRARNQRMRHLRSILRDRKKTIDSLIELKRGELEQILKTPTASPPKKKREPGRRLKRYYNDE